MIADDDPTAMRLREAVWADPTADAPRMVYADYLQEQGDPMGELIALQLERARTGAVISDREIELREPHGRRAAKPIELYLNRFELARGFIATGTPRRHMPPEIAMHPAWSTLERITIEAEPQPVLDNPHLQPFTLCAGDDLLFALSVGTKPLPAVALAGTNPNVGMVLTQQLMDAFEHRGVFEHVRAISLSAYHLELALSAHEVVLESFLMTQIEHLDLTFTSVRLDDLRMWKRWFLTTKLARISFAVPLAQNDRPPGMLPHQQYVTRPTRFLRVVLEREGEKLFVELEQPTEAVHLDDALAIVAEVGGERTRVVVQDIGDSNQIAKRQKPLLAGLRKAFADVIVLRGGGRSHAP